MLERPSRERPRRTRGSGAAVVRALLGVLLLVLAFMLGVAFARTLDERPVEGGVVTDVRTLEPLPQQPPARTVTVTVSEP